MNTRTLLFLLLCITTSANGMLQQTIVRTACSINGARIHAMRSLAREIHDLPQKKKESDIPNDLNSTTNEIQQNNGHIKKESCDNNRLKKNQRTMMNKLTILKELYDIDKEEVQQRGIEGIVYAGLTGLFCSLLNEDFYNGMVLLPLIGASSIGSLLATGGYLYGKKYLKKNLTKIKTLQEQLAELEKKGS